MSSRHLGRLSGCELPAQAGAGGVVPMSDAIDPAGTGDGLTELRRSVGGAVLAPTDTGFDAARRCFNALVDRRPAVIVRCLDADDVARAFDFARAHALQVAVRGGGHNPAGHCVCEGGLVIDLSLMRGVDVNGDARTACADGGATWLDFDAATQGFGLVTPGGVVGSTGVAGLTLGGGIGHLTAQHGLTCDNLIGAELVTPGGTVVRAGPDENPELLCGLRGGGGNFGVATRLEFQLHPLRRVLGGRLTYAGTGVRDALRRFRDLAARAPRDLSCEAVITLDGPLAPTLIVAPCYTGPDADPEELRALRTARGLAPTGGSPRCAPRRSKADGRRRPLADVTVRPAGPGRDHQPGLPRRAAGRLPQPAAGRRPRPQTREPAASHREAARPHHRPRAGQTADRRRPDRGRRRQGDQQVQ